MTVKLRRGFLLWHSKTRSPAQKPACKDLGRDGQDRAITPKVTYTPASERAGSRSQKKCRIQSLPLFGRDWIKHFDYFIVIKL
ncbi:alpha-galactosidase [Lacticaseibacillus zeae]|uniref:Alpha-galactosidase n=1 Tax=Lacticaseibacillus zeae TaxID=57037 RepID=A0A5R8LPW8_LACZE|nr:alpha-galactosidase [Lacticaseibacillus zeae]